MTKRILFGALSAALLFIFLLFGTPGLIALIYVVGFFAIYEFNKAMNHGGFHSHPILGYIFISLMVPSYFLFDLTGLFILFAMCMYINFMYFVVTQKVDAVMLYSNVQFVYPCLMLSFICPLLLKDLGKGYLYMILLILCCFGTDILAYFTGMLIGKHKLSPKISPKKTIEGAIGGFLGSILMALSVYFIFPLIFRQDLGFWLVMAVGTVCGVFAQFGDLTASLFKRICDIKDFGNLIPGHGGILDRLDSIMFCLPIVYFILLLFEFM